MYNIINKNMSEKSFISEVITSWAYKVRYVRAYPIIVQHLKKTLTKCYQYEEKQN